MIDQFDVRCGKDLVFINISSEDKKPLGYFHHPPIDNGGWKCCLHPKENPGDARIFQEIAAVAQCFFCRLYKSVNRPDIGWDDLFEKRYFGGVMADHYRAELYKKYLDYISLCQEENSKMIDRAFEEYNREKISSNVYSALATQVQIEICRRYGIDITDVIWEIVYPKNDCLL